MPRLLLCTVLLLFAASTFSTAEAQTLIVSQNKCDMARVGELRAFNDSAGITIWQELVNEGALLSAGAAYHWWGDEWNVVYYYVAESIPSFLDAFSEAVARWTERYPGAMELFQDACFEHKDSFYSLGEVTTPPPQ